MAARPIPGRGAAGGVYRLDDRLAPLVRPLRYWVLARGRAGAGLARAHHEPGLTAAPQPWARTRRGAANFPAPGTIRAASKPSHCSSSET